MSNGSVRYDGVVGFAPPVGYGDEEVVVLYLYAMTNWSTGHPTDLEPGVSIPVAFNWYRLQSVWLLLASDARR